jgi:uncharacterized repeat protein (TIGR02543 family)
MGHMKKTIVDESLIAIRTLIAVLCVVCGTVPAWAGHDTHYARVTVTASPTGQGKVYMTTDGDYVPEDGDWQNSMSAKWNCNDGVDDEADSRTYYVHAQATSGNHFVKWSSNSSGSDSKSTAAKYAYSTSAQSESSGSPTANNIYAIFEANPVYTGTFLLSENGTFKYQYGESAEVTVTSEHSVTTDQNFTFTALPDAGYTVYGWYTKSGETKTYFDYSSTTISSYALPGNISIGVDFVPVGTPIFQIKGSNQTYTDLNAAIAACGTAAKTIVLINNGTLPAGNYTIPANVTLLIPFDEGFTCYTGTPALTTNSFLIPEVYRTLTMSPGATLTVNGAISVSAKLSSRSGYGPNGATSGKYGAIKMLSEGNTQSKIILNSGAKLYGWGYIYGEGAVEALSGSTVYEGFVITDWRGGNNTLDMYNKRSTYKIFPFNQYYIQNIEVPLTLHKGATETVYSSVYGNGSDNPLSITMVGESSGLFRLTGAGAKLTKWYDPLYDRQHYELEGAAAINAISFTASGMGVSSSEYVLPITNNMDITVRSGATVSIAEDICIMPDASVTVEQGATMNIASAKNVYVYDIQAYTNAGTYTTSRGGYPSAGPGRYAAGDYVHRIAYSPSWAALSNREIRRLQNMSSAHFQVNGTLNVSGKLYTTEGGADIFSTADGAAIRLVSDAGTANKTYQVDHEGYDAYYYTIPVTSAQLHNADGTYQATAGNAANTTWTYANGHWGWCIIWRLEDGTELKRMYQPSQPNADWILSNAPETSKPDEGTCSYVFNGWNTVANTSQQEIILTADYTKTCAGYYDVLWKSEDGTETYETDEHVGNGETTRYNGAAPVKADDKTNGFTYTFDGWTTEPNGGGTKYNIGETPAATGDITYYAHFTATEVAAIITANGVVTYYPSIADAFTAANNSDYTPTIQVWRDAPNTPALTYTAKNHCTLDLNGHTVSGTEMPLLTINDEGFTFTVTDRTETKEGRLAGTSGVSQAFVVSLVSGVFRLEAGTVYGQNTGTGVMAGVYAGANREVIMTGGTIQVDANSGTGYGIFAQGKGTINGGTIRVESSAKAAYAVQAQGSNGNVTVTDGKFYAAGKTTVTCVLAKGGASLAVNGGYYNTNTNLATYLGAGCHVINLPASELPYQYKVGTGGHTVTFQNTDGTVLQSALWENGATPIFTGATPTKPSDTEGEWTFNAWTPALAPVTEDITYTATYIPTPPVASVTIGSGDPTEYIHFNDAWTAANSATAASTLTLLQDVTVTSQLTYNNSNNKNCILDLNGHTLTSNTSERSPLQINNTNVTFTITDDTEGKSGKLSLNTSSSSTIFGAYAENGHLLLNGGTIEVTSSTATACGVTINTGTFTMNGGTIHVKTTNGKEGRGIYANSTTTVNGGTVHVEAAGTAYGIRHDAGTMTINAGKFTISGSTKSYMNYADAADNKLIIKGGYYNIGTRLGTYVSAPYYVFDLTSGAEFDEGYRYKVAEAYTLAWETDGDEFTGDYSSGLTETGAAIVAPNPTKTGCIFAGWSPAFTGTMPAANTTYTATWAVASVIINGTTTLYTTFAPAWTAANSATAASTLTLLQDVTVNNYLKYDNSSKTNCTFNLNGHTVSTTDIVMFHLITEDVTFTLTDDSEGQSGKVSVHSNDGSTAYGVLVSKGRFVLDAGTIEANLRAITSQGVRVANGASFTMNGGKIDVETTNNRNGDGVFVNTTGTAIIGGGEIHVNAAATGYAVNAAGTTTITGGKFSAEGGSSAACVYRTGTLTLQGGYYSLNTNLAANCAANYHVFSNSDASYPHKVAEGYTVTFKNGEDTLQSSLWETGATPLYSGESPVKAATAQYTYTFNGWSPAVSAVTANVTYTAQFSSTVNTYTVTWKDVDGTTLETDENVPYGNTPEYNGATPTKAATAQYTYTFNGWNVPIAPVTANVTYTAQFSSTVNTYTVTWKDVDGTTLRTDAEVPYGTIPSYGSIPTKAKDAEYAYTFNGWSPAVTAVTGDATYTATYTTTPVVASVTVNASGKTFYYTDFSTAFAEANGATFAVTITLLKDVSSAALQYSSNNTDCTLDLNGHTLTSTAEQLILNINKAGSTFTITDKSESKSGQMRIEAKNTSEAYGVYVSHGHLKLEAGTIYASLVATTGAGVRAVNANSSFTMDGGTIHVVTTNAKNGIGVTASNGTTTINGGTILVEAAKDGYGINRTGGTVTVDGGKFNISATDSAYATNQASANASVVIRGGYYTTNSQLYPTAPYHVFGLTSGAEFDEGYRYKVTEGYTVTFKNGDVTLQSGLWEKGATPLYSGETPAKAADAQYTYTFNGWSPAVSDVTSDATYTAQFSSTVNTYTVTWKNADGTTLETDENVPYGNTPEYNGATPVKATDAEYAYTFNGWSPEVGTVTGDVTYTATYTTTPVVASVTANEATTYYTEFADAWTAANSATAASTLTLLQDISGLSSTRTYSASHDLTLDLNGHTLSGSGTSLFQISCTGYTFTVTDGSANHNGKLLFTTAESSTSSFHCVIVNKGTFVLEAGTIEATSSTASIGAVQVVGGTFTMNENGAVHAKYTGNVNGNNSRLVHAKSGTTTINGGSIRLESTKDAIGVVYSSGNVTFNGGLFHITASGTAAVTNKTEAINSLNIRGGYYSANYNTYFTPHVKTPYHIFSNSDAEYPQKVAEGYTVTFNNYDGTSLQSGLWEKGATPTYSGETPTKHADAHYTYTFDTWSPAISSVTTNATYTAQYSSTVNKYTVIFKNGDEVLQSSEVEYGTSPAYVGTTPTKTTDAEYAYTFETWSPTVSAVTGDATYTATYTTTPVVASVTVNSTTTYYTSFADAWTTANSATAASTLTLLQDITGLSSTRTYSALHDLMLDLNGHTLSGSGTSLFQISCTGYTFTVTDGSANHNGKLLFTTAESSTSSFHCVIVNNGTFVLEAGTIEATSSTASIGAVQVVGGTFTMNENGAVHAIYTGNVTGKNSRLVHANGTNGIININGGSIRLESTKDAIGVVYSSGNVTFNGGLFNISALGTAAVTNQNVAKDYLNIRGGYYSANNNTYFTPHVKTPYHIFSNSDAEYPQKVAEGYTVTFNNYDGTSLQSGLWEKGTTPTYSGETPTKPADAHYTYTFDTWSPAILSVTANATYTATYNNTPKPQESIVVNERETVTIDANTETTTTIVHVSGLLTVADDVTLTTTDLILEATPSSSGEIIGDVSVNQNAYFDLSQPGGFKARTWYAVAVPWQVDVPEYALGDVSLSNDGETYTPQTLGSTFDLIYYDGARRATGASKAWNYVEDDPADEQVMVPGRAYMIYLTTDANVIRFRKSANAALHTNTLAVYEYDSDEPKDADWNGIANPATFKAFLNVGSTENRGQIYNADTKQYELFNMSENKLVVGQPIFVQPAEETTIVANADSYANPSLAPRRTNAQETSMTRYEVMFAPNEGDVTDRIIVRLNEEKEENAYVVGQDLVKMGVSDMVPQMWVDRYDSKMCINTVAPVNNKADYPLGISVQQSGAYDLFIDDQSDDETMLYLTYDGDAIWNLSYGGYVVNLEKGTNSHYGLRIVYAPQTATGIENVQRDNVQCTKVLMDDHVFIIRGGNIYTMDGQLVK